MRKLGIDFGTKKLGLALTDEAGNMAFPHGVIPNDEQLLSTIEALIAEKDVTEIIIGHSLAHDGTPNPVHEDVETFIADLTLRVPVPIQLEPEQLTTAQASLLTGKNDRTDAAAAAIILDTWLQRQTTSTPVERAAAAVEATHQTEPGVPAISFDDFLQVEIKLGTIQAVAVVEGADKLLRLTVDVGETAPRQIVSGIREFFTDEQKLVGRQCPFVTNLPPRTIRGVESQGMILAASTNDTFALFHPSESLPAGTRLS